MAKNGQKQAGERGQQLLAEWGVAGDLEALRSAWGRHPDADAAIVARLERRGDREAAAVLAALEKSAPSKLARRLVRRALFRLRQRGIEIPEHRESESAPPIFGPSLEGYLTPSSGTGDQLLWLVRPMTGGILLLEARVHDPDGMVEAAAYESSRKKLRRLWEAIRETLGLRVVAAEWRYVDWRMFQAYEWAAGRRTSPPGEYPTLRASLVARPAAEVRHPLFALLDAERVREDPTWLAGSDQLIGEPELQSWSVPPEVSERCERELESAETSPLVLSQFQMEDRVAGIARSCLELIFAPEKNASYARRLLDVAYVFCETERANAARHALAVALALQEGRPPADIPFCQRFARLELARIHVRRKEREAERKETSLIVTPQQAQREARRPAGPPLVKLRTR